MDSVRPTPLHLQWGHTWWEELKGESSAQLRAGWEEEQTSGSHWEKPGWDQEVTETFASLRGGQNDVGLLVDFATGDLPASAE